MDFTLANDKVTVAEWLRKRFMKTENWYRLFLALICLGLMLFLAINNAQAGPRQQAETDYAAVDGYLNTQMNDLGIPGMALGIVEDGEIAHLQGYGTADSTGREVTPQTPFHVGSVTKSFTALAVMQLVEAGKIDLDAPIQAYLPWFTLADEEAAAKITVRNLLNHTSGISTYDGNRGFTSNEDLEARVRGLNNRALSEPVGETFQYSNINYDIAGFIVEKVSGQSYADYVAEHIFEPLEMRHAYASEADALADGLAAGHLYMFGKAVELNRSTPPSHLPSGYLMASAEDLAHYAVAQLNDGRYGDAQIVSPENMFELQRPAVPTTTGDSTYAMGWVNGSMDGTSTLWHDGADGRNYAIMILMPDSDSGFILLANAIGFAQVRQGHELALNIFNLLNGKPAAPVSSSFGPMFLYWAIVLTPFLMLLGIVLTWRYWRGKSMLHTLLVVLLFGGTASLWLIVMSNLLQSPIWSGFRVNISNPELAYSLLAGTVLGFGWSVVFTVVNLWVWGRKERFVGQ
jgi:CubicO group peptidase (beta-lactamase class C family)